MADPIMIFQSATVPGSYVSLLELKDANGSSIVVPVALNASDSGRRAFLTSVYGKDEKVSGKVKPRNEWFVDQIKGGDLRYINIEKSARRARGVGLQLPIMPLQPQALLGAKIPTESDPVKLRAATRIRRLFRRNFVGSTDSRSVPITSPVRGRGSRLRFSDTSWPDRWTPALFSPADRGEPRSGDTAAAIRYNDLGRRSGASAPTRPSLYRRLAGGVPVNRDMEKIKSFLVREPDSLKRGLLALGYLSEMLRERGLPSPKLVGGAVVEFYTRSSYKTTDFDLICEDKRVVRDTLERMGFRPFSSRGLYSEELDIHFDLR
ncbi:MULTISPECIES: hypothetical protein [Synergistales]|uniref:MuF-C-terminal domain-containing protein n=1 Tax=Synergistales TaxID=649776 RepID=UPI00236766E7|nr:hypothetical protein [Aminithiophilus ramosus]